MRARIGILALILALVFLAAVPFIRKAQEKAVLESLADNRRYEAALYYAHVVALDSTTSKPIQFRLQWDTELVSPFSKGSGPSVVENLPDGSKILSVVGVRRTAALRVEVVADGFRSDFIDVEAQGGGILTQDTNRLLRTISLTSPSLGDANTTEQ